MYKLVNRFLDVLYPRKSRCCLCGRESSKAVCRLCLGNIKHINGRICLTCGKALNDNYKELYCPDCNTTKHSFDSAYSCFEYEGAGKAMIHKLKYEGRLELARYIADFMYQRLKYEDINADVIIPVPIHEAKLAKRGFNQSLVIAEHLSRLMRLEVADCLMRIKDTKDQYNLDKQQRIVNVIGAFSDKMMYNVSKYNTVLLLDDIYTTGSTVEQCSKILKNKNVNKVIVITAATGSNT